MMGVTGTNGKTTTTYLLKHILEVCMDAKVGLIGTNGNMIGDEFLPTERTTPESYELQKLPARDGRRGLHPRRNGGLVPLAGARPRGGHHLRLRASSPT